jgi:hypothetical protein
MQPTLTWPHCHAYNITNANVSTTFRTVQESPDHSRTHVNCFAHSPRSGPLRVGQVRAGRTPVIVVACGSYSPITIMHLRLLEDTRDAINTVSTASALALAFRSIVLAHASDVGDKTRQTRQDTFDTATCDHPLNRQLVAL